MARRKAQFLELLREQREGQSSPSESRKTAPQERPQPSAESAPSRSRPDLSSAKLPSLDGLRHWMVRFPWVAAVLVLALAIPLIWWMSGQFGSTALDAATDDPNQPAASASGAGSLPGEASGSHRPWSVRVIVYDFNERNSELAKETARALLKLQFPDVNALLQPGDAPERIEIYVGEAADRQDLQTLLQRVQQTEYPAGSGRKPFASALILRQPEYVKN